MADGQLNTPAGIFADGWARLGPPGEVRPLGEGHIHETLLVTVRGRQRYVLQRLNAHVFEEPARVMANLTRVLDHLQTVAPGLVPELIGSDRGSSAWVDGQGGWWRLWRFIDPSRSLSQTGDPVIARSAGACFGRFHRLMRALPGPALEPVIPGFLELEGYLARFDSLAAGSSGAALELEFVEAWRDRVGRFPAGDEHIHGDCKLNNLLFAPRHPKVLALLDLDTVMLGHWAWDFGDLTRSLLAGFEDGEMGDACRLFAEVVRGFTGERGSTLDPEALVLAPRHVGFMLGVRFLTDHLEGDRYFRVARRGDNLERARKQFALVRRLEAHRQPFLAAATEIVDHPET